MIPPLESQNISVTDTIIPKELLSSLGSSKRISYIGNIKILNQPLLAFFCSRKCPGDAILKAYDLARELREKETPVISGFHTLVEKDILEILLKGKGSIVICPARGLEGMRIPKVWSSAIEQGRLLLVSIFDQRISRVTKESAHQRNLLVAALASERVFIHVEPGGEIEKLSIMLAI